MKDEEEKRKIQRMIAHFDWYEAEKRKKRYLRRVAEVMQRRQQRQRGLLKKSQPLCWCQSIKKFFIFSLWN